MLRALFRKQMAELGAFLVQDVKTGKRRTKRNQIGYVILLASVTVMMLAIFGGMANTICQPLVSVGLGWFYFAMMGLVSIAFGVFGSVFSTYSSLYLAKDNESLLSMPIPEWMILVVRMSGVYVMGLIYEALVMLPAVVVYLTKADHSPLAIVLSVLSIFSVSLFVLILSCVLGWVVAAVSIHLKNRSFITVILSLAFIGAYYYFYSKALSFLQDIVVFGQEHAADFQRVMLLFYHMGKGAEGDILSFFIFTFVTVAILGVCLWVLSRSFLRFTTTNTGAAKAKYKESEIKTSSLSNALLKKEWIRFTRSSTYMLNCGLGILAFVVMAVAAIIKADWIQDNILLMYAGKEAMLSLLGTAALCMTASMNDISAPSISLEGKNLWILQTLPVQAWDVLGAKLKIHILLGGIPAVFAGVALIYAFRIPVGMGILMIGITVLYTLFEAELGLILNLKNASFSWSNEMAPIKQSMSVMITMFSGWILVALFALLYFAVSSVVRPELYLGILLLLLIFIDRLLLSWLRTRGAVIFESY